MYPDPQKPVFGENLTDFLGVNSAVEGDCTVHFVIIFYSTAILYTVQE